MKVKILLIFSVLLSLQCSPEKEYETSLLQFMPENASAIIKINDYNSFTAALDDNELVKKLQTLDLSKKISKLLVPLNYAQPSQEALLGFTIDSLQKLNFTFTASDTIPYLQLSEVTDKKIETLQHKDFDIKKYTVEGHDFFTIKLNGKEVLSSSITILKELISSFTTRNTNQQLAKFYRVSDPSKLAHLWINLNYSDVLLQYLTETRTAPLPSGFADWLFLDISLGNEGLFLNGISTAEASETNYLSLFTGAKPLANSTFEMLPANVSSFASYTFSDYTSFSTNQMRYLNQNTALDSLFNTIEEIGTAQLGKEPLVLMKTFGTDQITDYLKAKRKSAEAFQGSEIWELGDASLLVDTFRPLVSGFESNYSSVLENTLIFAQDKKVLEKVIIAYKNANTIQTTNLFQNIEALTTEASSILAIANAKGFEDRLTEYNFIETAKQLGEAKLSDYIFGSEIISDAGFFHSSYFIKKNSAKKVKNSITPLFTLHLDADLRSVPQFVTNHRTKMGELIVQDMDNVLYLVSNNGKVLWKKELDGALQGKVHQVDLYKNGKLQFAFTTNNKFLILDRNGKEVKPFSIAFPGGNLNPLAVFDYEGKKDYRFVVTQNQKVFMYNNKGKIVSGFKFTSAPESIIEAPQHFKIDRKDYLVFKLANNTLKILNRVGKVRIKTNEKIPFSDNSINVYQNKISLTSNKGLLYQIDTKGKLSKTDLGLQVDHGFDATSKTLAIMDDNVLRIRDKEVSLDLGVYSKPTIFYINDKIYVSVTDIQNQKSYLFDSQAVPVPNFPIYGSSVIDMANIDSDRKPELVIKEQDNSFTVYKIN
ncbi:ribonuclease HII [Maribacter chungangensis]|uniref:Ribonuclease HII n=1 Tax=Maribacter chungangensis TaxID=1069117 RepID=A0ABW3B5Z6_9FLAO